MWWSMAKRCLPEQSRGPRELFQTEHNQCSAINAIDSYVWGEVSAQWCAFYWVRSPRAHHILCGNHSTLPCPHGNAECGQPLSHHFSKTFDRLLTYSWLTFLLWKITSWQGQWLSCLSSKFLDVVTAYRRVRSATTKILNGFTGNLILDNIH
jgi:hypothetical protein